MYRLLSNPEYIEPLRQEVEAAVAEEGWTKAGLDKMYKIDSFLRETPSPDEFDGFRFAKLRERDGGSMASRQQIGTTGITHVPFGHGRHAW